jgi:hypothetical protein
VEREPDRGLRRKQNPVGPLPEDKLTEIQTLHEEARALYDKCQTASYTKVDMGHRGHAARKDKGPAALRLRHPQPAGTGL